MKKFNLFSEIGIVIIYGKEYPEIIHQIPNTEGNYDHSSYIDRLNNIRIDDFMKPLEYPDCLADLTKQGAVVILRDNIGFKNTNPFDLLIFFPKYLTEFQFQILETNDNIFKEAREINLGYFDEFIQNIKVYQKDNLKNYELYINFILTKKKEFLKASKNQKKQYKKKNTRDVRD